MFSGRGFSPQSTACGRGCSSGASPPRYSALFGSPSQEETTPLSKPRRHRAATEDPQYHTPVEFTTALERQSREPSAGNDSFSGIDPKISPSEDYTFDIGNTSRSTPWATLRLHSSEPLSSRKPKHPRFTNMASIIGKVELSLPSPQTIRSIKLVLRGTLVAGASLEVAGTIPFLKHTFIIWDRKFGDPHSQESSGSSHKSNGKLDGNWTFPFSIPFPRSVDLGSMTAIYSRRDDPPLRFAPQRANSNWLDTRPPSSYPRIVSEEGESNFGGVVPYINFHSLGFEGSSQQALSQKSSMPTKSPSISPSPCCISSPLSSPSIYTSLPRATGSPPRIDQSRAPISTSSQAFSSEMHRGATNMLDSPLPPIHEAALPRTFFEKEIKTDVRYELTLVVSSGSWRFMTSESSVATPIFYVPVTRPPRSTLGRQIANQEKEPPPGPGLDPEGWKQLAPVTIRGFYRPRRGGLDIQYNLYLASPLSYARGTFLSCCLVIACQDVEALDVLANPHSPRVRLRRSTRSILGAADDAAQLAMVTKGSFSVWDESLSSVDAKYTPPPIKLVERARLQSKKPAGQLCVDQVPLLSPSDEIDEHEIGPGTTWWTPSNVVQDPHTRRLMGEIHLPKGLQPSCHFPLFNVLYFVELLAPVWHAFQPEPGQGRPAIEREKGCELVFLSQLVEVTSHARDDEPAPVSFTRRSD